MHSTLSHLSTELLKSDDLVLLTSSRYLKGFGAVVITVLAMVAWLGWCCKSEFPYEWLVI